MIMSFKTKSIIKLISLNLIILAIGVLLFSSLFGLAARVSYNSPAASISLYCFASIGSLVFTILFVCTVKATFYTNCIEYNDNGIMLYRPKFGEDFIPWKSVTSIEIWRLPIGFKKAYIFTEKYCNAYTSPRERGIFANITLKNDALKLTCTERLLMTIESRCPDIEIKRFTDVPYI